MNNRLKKRQLLEKLLTCVLLGVFFPWNIPYISNGIQLQETSTKLTFIEITYGMFQMKMISLLNSCWLFFPYYRRSNMENSPCPICIFLIVRRNSNICPFFPYIVGKCLSHFILNFLDFLKRRVSAPEVQSWSKMGFVRKKSELQD